MGIHNYFYFCRLWVCFTTALSMVCAKISHFYLKIVNFYSLKITIHCILNGLFNEQMRYTFHNSMNII